MYAVKEIYFTIQGEGAHTGRPAVFLRFSGCNLWSGQEKTRKTAECQFCDTDFIGVNGINGGRYQTAEILALKAKSLWPVKTASLNGLSKHNLQQTDSYLKNKSHKYSYERPFIVCTGGEPLLQLDSNLIHALHKEEFEIALETNGTILVPKGIDWITVSPKKLVSELVQRTGDELKLVYPQQNLTPEMFSGLAFKRFSLQPLDNAYQQDNIKKAYEYCMQNPNWHLSLQIHKWLGIP